jgi:hypothetical protein
VHQNQTNRRDDTRHAPARRHQSRGRLYGSGVGDRRLSLADSLFAQLDRQRVGIGPNSWTTKVYGVYLEQNGAWVQLGPSSDLTCSVLLHLPASCSPNHALAALESWLRQPPDGRSRVVEVMHVA